MTENHLVSLIVRHWSGELTEEEAAELKQWADASVENQLLLDRITDENELEKELDVWRNLNPAEAYPRIGVYLKMKKRARVRRIIGWSAAAALVIAVSVIGLDQRSSHRDQPRPV